MGLIKFIAAVQNRPLVNMSYSVKLNPFDFVTFFITSPENTFTVSLRIYKSDLTNDYIFSGLNVEESPNCGIIHKPSYFHKK